MVIACENVQKLCSIFNFEKMRLNSMLWKAIKVSNRIKTKFYAFDLSYVLRLTKL